MKIVSHSEIKSITPAMAQSFLTENNFHLQRKQKSSHINSLVAVMQNGEFPPGTSLYFVQSPTRLDLIDGQHRLRAQIIAKIDTIYSVVTFTCADEKAAGTLYTQFDIGAKRTITDRMKALNLKEHTDLPPAQANLLAASAPYLKSRFGKVSSFQISQMTPLQRLDILKEFEPGARLFFSSINSAEKWILKPLMKPHLVALGTYLCQFAPETAPALWKAIASNTCGDAEDPRYHMLNLLQNSELKFGGGVRKATSIAQAFIVGWNSFVEGKKLLKKLTPAPAPHDQIKILGVSDDWLEEKISAENMKKLEVEFAKNMMEKIFPSSD